MAADRVDWMQARMRCVPGEIEQMEHLMKCVLAPKATVRGTGSVAYFHCCLKPAWPLRIWTALICISILTRRTVIVNDEYVFFFFLLHRCKDCLVGRCLQAVNAWCSWRLSLRRSVWGELLTALASRTRRPISDLLPRRQQLLHTLHLTPIPAPSPPPPWCCHRGNVTNCKFTNPLISSQTWHCDSTP